MLIRVQHLLDRLRQPRSRADEVRQVRAGLRAAAAATASPAVRALARSLRQLRAESLASQGAFDACGGCARGHAWPAGQWDGGHCCSGATEDIFSDDELTALALAGTRPSSLRAPAGEHAGCAFRGGDGCSLAPVDRPNVCVRYVCRDLTRELAGRGDIDHVMARIDRLDDMWRQFIAARHEIRPPSQ